jgi:hypothetical protein
MNYETDAECEGGVHFLSPDDEGTFDFEPDSLGNSNLFPGISDDHIGGDTFDFGIDENPFP